MKKYIFCFISVIIMLISVSVCIFALENPTFEVDTIECSAGETVDVRINIKNNPGLASAKFVVSYDSGLTVEGVKFGNIGGMTMLPQKYDSPFVLNWFSALKELKEDTVYATITFKTPSNPTKNKYSVSIAYNQNDVFNINEKDVYFEIVNGGVVVKGQIQETTESSTTIETTSVSTKEIETTSKIETSETTSYKETHSTIQTIHTIPVYTTQQTVETTSVISTTETDEPQTVYVESTEMTTVIPTIDTTSESTPEQVTILETTSVQEETITESEYSGSVETTNDQVTTEETKKDSEKKNSAVVPIIIVSVCIVGAALVWIFVIKGKKQKAE